MRSKFYSFNSGGELMATLYLTSEESAYRTDITTVDPPDETEELKAVFDGEGWALVDRYPPPDPAP